MSKKSQEPKRDFGFYATIPRIVRTKYKNLSHAEKWLYVCLKDLCGDKGTCFRTLRALSEETDVSTGSLSKMIPSLHKVGLIHAEKKRRTESGKEVWHITIADVWAENAKACSKNEQSASEVVQNPNKDVQNLNNKSENGSKNERDCSNFVDRRNNTEERTITEGITEEERKITSSSTSLQPGTDSFSHSSSSSAIIFSQEEELIYGFAKELKLSYLKRNEKNKAHCTKLVSKGVVTLEQMKSLLRFCKQRPYLTGKDLNLGNLASDDELNGWLQTQEKSPLLVGDRAMVSFRDSQGNHHLSEAARGIFNELDEVAHGYIEQEQQVTDEDIDALIAEHSHIHWDSANISANKAQIKHMQHKFGVSNYQLFDDIKNASRNAKGAPMSEVFRQLTGILNDRYAEVRQERV